MSNVQHLRTAHSVIAGSWSAKRTLATSMTTALTTMTAIRQGGGRVGASGGSGGSSALTRREVGTINRSGRRSISLLMVQQQSIIPCRDMTSSSCNKVLTEENVFMNLRKMEYAVRGPLLLRALEIEKELQKVSLH